MTESQTVAGVPDPARTRKDFEDRLSETFDSAAKVIAALAGIGVLFYVVGISVMWVRLRKLGLPAEESLGVLPRDQLVLVGVREVVLSAASGAILLFLLGFALLRFGRITQAVAGRIQKSVLLGGLAKHPPVRWIRSLRTWLSARDSRVWRGVQWLVERMLLSAVLLALCFLFFPLSKWGIGCAVVLAGSLYYGIRVTLMRLRKPAARFPLWRITVAVVISVVAISVARQREFPTEFAPATIVMMGEPAIQGLYVGRNSDSVLLGLSKNDIAPPHGRQRSRLLVVERDSVRRIRLRKAQDVVPKAESLLDLLGVSIACIPPECRVGGDRISLW